MSSPAHARLGFRRISATALVAIALAVVPKHAMADQGGVSFWLPGQYGSLAAAPQQPGWMLGTVYYHTSVEASANVSAAREIQIGKLSPTLSANLNANLDAKADLALFAPSYVFASPVLGGQLAVGFTAIYGRMSTSVDATLNATLGPLGFTRSGGISDAATGFGDLYPLASLRWNAGVHNFMTYMTGGIPVGNYDSTRLSNIGIGHGAIDGGVGYTYFDPQKGHEFSFVTGLTHNFRNPDTDYRNGANWHLDWGASQFLSKQVHVGLVDIFTTS